MKKSSFVALVLGVIGGVFFALGMCMCLLPEWNMFKQGVIAGVIGVVVLLIDLLVWRKMTGKAPVKVSGKTVGTVIVGVAGALLLGVGMTLCLVLNKMLLGILIGLVGIVILLMLIPPVKGLHD